MSRRYPCGEPGCTECGNPPNPTSEEISMDTPTPGTVAIVEGRVAVLIARDRNGDTTGRWQWMNGDWTTIPLGDIEVLGHVDDLITSDGGCDCTELCAMGPTCPGGMTAGLPGSGCARTLEAPPGGHPCHITAPHGAHPWTPAVPDPRADRVLHIDTSGASTLTCPGRAMSGERWRPIHRRLPDEAVALMAEQRAAGQTPSPVHLMLVDDADPRERSRTGCGRGLGEWVSGDAAQVTCRTCLAVAHV